jgi:endonuclease/exonuclease/phosphatase family metal-dependent hydrolase
MPDQHGTPSTHDRRSARRRLSTAAITATVLAGLITLVPALLGGPAGSAAEAVTLAVGPAPAGRQSERPTAATTFRVATFNVLGASHTGPHDDNAKYPSAKKRMGWAVQLINEHQLSIVGFQEMEHVQYDRFTALEGGAFATYPGRDPDQLVVANNIAWRTDTWRLMSATTFSVPYFYGKFSRRPLVLLQNVHTGQEVYVMNTHNPADVRGKAQQWRDQAVRIEAALINQLRATHPDIPVLFTGDMNDWNNFFCPVTALAPVHSSSGGTHVLSPVDQCQPSQPSSQIDWVMGTPDVSFSGFTRFRDAVEAQTSDHALYWADATVAPAPVRASGITHVVAVDAEGLSSKVLKKAGARGAPFLTRLREHGAATLNARTEQESMLGLPNTISMVTGRKILRKYGGGHGVKHAGDTGRTVASFARSYVPGVFDVVHDFGHSTALISSDPDARLIKRSWSAKHGATDRTGRNNGKKKLTKAVLKKSDKAAAAAFTKTTRHLKAFTYVQLSGLVESGTRHGWGSAKSMKALHTLDTRIKHMVRAIEANPATAGSTMVVVTASSGGKHHSQRGTKAANYRIPFIVWGHGVPAGDLYAMNPSYLDPHGTNPGYTGGQPIRNGMVADLVTSTLGLPAVPGSVLDSGEDLNVFIPPTTTVAYDPANLRSATKARRAGARR